MKRRLAYGQMNGLRKIISKSWACVFVFAGAWVPAPYAWAQGEPLGGPIVTLQLENDYFANVTNTDRHYTNGFRASWLSDEDVRVPGWLADISDLPSLFVQSQQPVRRRVGISLGHSIFTPDDTDTSALVVGDRPYGGWLNLGLSLHAIHGDTEGRARQDTFALDLGVVGPAARGEVVQNTYHNLINVARSNGWSHELKNEPGVNVVFERRWKSANTDVVSFDMGGAPSTFEVDFIPHIGASLGNVMTYGAGGGMVRFGQNLCGDFGPPRIRPGVPGSESFCSNVGVNWYLFAGAEARWVRRNIFLDGNTFRDSHRVARKPWVGDFQLGASVRFGQVRVSYTHVLTTREFKQQSDIDQFGALSVSFQY